VQAPAQLGFPHTNLSINLGCRGEGDDDQCSGAAVDPLASARAAKELAEIRLLRAAVRAYEGHHLRPIPRRPRCAGPDELRRQRLPGQAQCADNG